MSELVFYTNPMSRGRIVHWLLEELGQPYETQWLEYGESMGSPAFLKVNPLGKVPTVTHRGEVITEAAAICAYLAQAYPQSGLYPEDEAGRAKFYRWLFFAAGPLEMIATCQSMQWQVPPEKERSVGFGNVDRALNVLAEALSNSSYLCGEHFSAADVYLGSALIWGKEFGTMPTRPAFEPYISRLQERDGLRRANQINDDYMARAQSPE